MLFLFFAILPFMTCLFWSVVYILEWNESSPAKRNMSVFMCVAAVLYLCHALFFVTSVSGVEGNESDSIIMPIANSVYAFCNLAVYPLYYFYIRRLTDKCIDTKRNLRINILLLLPSCIIGIWAIANNFIFPDNGTSETMRLFVTKILFFAMVLPVSYYSLKRLNEFDKQLEDYYSDIENRSVRKTRAIMIVLVVCSLCSVAVNHLGREYFYDNNMLAIPSLLFSSLLFTVGYVGIKQCFTTDDLEKEVGQEKQELTMQPETDIQQLVTEAGAINNKLREKFERLMIEKRLFLECDLKLMDVAVELGICRSALSAFINQSLGVSFSDYVNRLRINYAKDYLKNLKEPDTIKVVHSYSLFGFSSEASFYRSFRKYTGMTPSQFLTKEENK